MSNIPKNNEASANFIPDPNHGYVPENDDGTTYECDDCGVGVTYYEMSTQDGKCYDCYSKSVPVNWNEDAFIEAELSKKSKIQPLIASSNNKHIYSNLFSVVSDAVHARIKLHIDYECEWSLGCEKQANLDYLQTLKALSADSVAEAKKAADVWQQLTGSSYFYKQIESTLNQ